MSVACKTESIRKGILILHCCFDQVGACAGCLISRNGLLIIRLGLFDIGHAKSSALRAFWRRRAE